MLEDAPSVLEELARRKTPAARRARVSARLAELARRQDVVGEHNAAAALGDAGLWRAASRHIERAFALGADAAESWLVRARTRMQEGDMAGAEQAYLETLRRQPLNHAAHRELAQLHWMLTADSTAAFAFLDRAIAANPQAVALSVLKAQALEGAGFAAEACAVLRPMMAAYCRDAGLAAIVSQTALSAGDLEAALHWGKFAFENAASASPAAVAYASACLAAGRLEAAEAPITALRSADGANQHAIALKALKWRLERSPRYGALYDYASFVRAYPLRTPEGWPSLAAYVSDLARALDDAHRTRTHPFNQSIKRGTQAANILDIDDAALRALPQALDAPIRNYVRDIGEGTDPLRARRSGDYAIHGVWSIAMTAGGRHVSHVHSEGWISSACHLAMPQGASGREGWLAFGEAGIPTGAPCEAEHFVEPQCGRIVFFPSYMWHGTIPFSGPGRRLTFALDIVPE